MRLPLLVLVAAMLATVPAASAQWPQTGSLALSVRRVSYDMDGALADGRLSPLGGATTRLEADFDVEFPPLAYCTSDEVEVFYNVEAPTFAQVELSPTSESRRIGGPVPVVLPATQAIQPQRVDGFRARLLVSLMPNAPAFQTVPIELTAVAMPTVWDTCSAYRSDPMTVTFLLVVDYYPRLQLEPVEDPWTSDGFRFVASNFGNGESRLTFEFESLSRQWVPIEEERTLQSAAISGKASAWTKEITLSRLNAPLDWTGRIKATQSSIQPGDHPLRDEQVLMVGTPPPLGAGDEGEALEDVENVPGWGGVGSLAAIAVALLRRRLG